MTTYINRNSYVRQKRHPSTLVFIVCMTALLCASVVYSLDCNAYEKCSILSNPTINASNPQQIFTEQICSITVYNQTDYLVANSAMINRSDGRHRYDAYFSSGGNFVYNIVCSIGQDSGIQTGTILVHDPIFNGTLGTINCNVSATPFIGIMRTIPMFCVTSSYNDGYCSAAMYINDTLITNSKHEEALKEGLVAVHYPSEKLSAGSPIKMNIACIDNQSNSYTLNTSITPQYKPVSAVALPLLQWGQQNTSFMLVLVIIGIVIFIILLYLWYRIRTIISAMILALILVNMSFGLVCDLPPSTEELPYEDIEYACQISEYDVEEYCYGKLYSDIGLMSISEQSKAEYGRAILKVPARDMVHNNSFMIDTTCTSRNGKEEYSKTINILYPTLSRTSMDRSIYLRENFPYLVVIVMFAALVLGIVGLGISYVRSVR